MKKTLLYTIVSILLLALVGETLVLLNVVNLEKIRRISLTKNHTPPKARKSVSVPVAVENKMLNSKDVSLAPVLGNKATARKAKKRRRRKKKPQDALSEFVNAYIDNLKKYPESLGYSYSNLGILSLKNRDLKRAVHYFALANKARPDDAQTAFNLAVSYFKSKNKAQMYSYLKKAYSLKPNDSRIAELYAYYSYLNKNYKAAGEAYDRLVKKGNPRAYVMSGNINMRMKNFGAAKALLQKALKSKQIGPRYRGILEYNIGNAYFNLAKTSAKPEQDYKRALQSFDLAAKQGVNDAYFNRGLTLYKLMRIKDALASFRYYNKDTTEKLFMMANCYYLLAANSGQSKMQQTEQLEKARKLYEKLEKRSKPSDVLYYNLLMTYYKLGDAALLKSTLKEYEKSSVSAGKQDDIIYFYKALGSIYDGNKDYDSEIGIYSYALTKFPQNASFLYLLGIAYENAKEFDKAVETYKKLRNEVKEDEYPDVYYRIAFINYKLGKITQAAQILEHMRTTLGENEDILYLLGDIYYKKKEYDIAEDNFNKVINQYKNKKAVSLSYAKLAEIYDNRQNYTAAISYIDKAIKTDAKNPGFYYNKAIILHHKGDLIGARDALNLAKSMVNFDQDIYINLGNIYFELGKFDRARKMYNAVLKHVPDNIEAAYNLNQILKVEGRIKK